MARVAPTNDQSNRAGVPPRQREYDEAVSRALLNDDVNVVIERANITPAPVDPAATWSYVVPFHLEDSNGLVIPFNGTIAATASESTSGGGTADPDTATPTVTNGYGTVTFSGTEHVWDNGETATLTLTYTDLRGSTDADTWVVTFTA